MTNPSANSPVDSGKIRFCTRNLLGDHQKCTLNQCLECDSGDPAAAEIGGAGMGLAADRQRNSPAHFGLAGFGIYDWVYIDKIALLRYVNGRLGLQRR
jgi:hypothetical protein